MSEQRSRKIVAVALVWLFVVAGAAVVYKLFIAPEKAEEELRNTGTASSVHTTLRIAHDSFSGYAILRSPGLAERMLEEGVALDFKDDGADYDQRIRDLRDGNTDLAVFTIDALLQASAAIGEFPASIVLLIDETRGADAMVSWGSSEGQGVGEIGDLNQPGAEVVRTPASPSDTLARVVYDHFAISVPLEGWLKDADGVEEVYESFMQSSHDARRAFVLWEPYVSKAVEAGGKVLVSSADVRGYIVDVLVVSRQFLSRNKEQVHHLVEAYLREAYDLRAERGAMRALVLEDARRLGESLTSDQAQKLVDTIHWQNTLENYAHFGLLSKQDAGSLRYLEEMLRSISRVLVHTGALESDPLKGLSVLPFSSGVLQDFMDEGFHPGRLTGSAHTQLLNDAPIDEGVVLRALDEREWQGLRPVGDLRVDPISFGRAKSTLLSTGKRRLAELAARLKEWPYYYLTVVGHSRPEGDAQANRLLAEARARSAADYLIELGVSADRIRSRAQEPSGGGGAAQSVSFQLGELPY